MRTPKSTTPKKSVPNNLVLDIRGLAYAYPDGHQALFGVDLHVQRNERVALLGPNGAGKTTLVLHLNGILTGGAGSVTVSGLPVVESASSSKTPMISSSWPRCAKMLPLGQPTLALMVQPLTVEFTQLSTRFR
jgi:ABC-type transport system involved in cytochrome bd biosynthesis fused ATPase/permease subunit